MIAVSALVTLQQLLQEQEENVLEQRPREGTQSPGSVHSRWDSLMGVRKMEGSHSRVTSSSPAPGVPCFRFVFASWALEQEEL